jgi:hypothetical protein
MVMKFVEVERLPGVKARKKKLRHIFEEFINMNVEIAKFEFDETEYKNARSAYGNLHKHAREHGVPVSVHIRNNEIYFKRRD